ncbi:MAG: hypothetical protein QOF66_669 [Mycobacterium sp.]|nr:hypothetical protein [Mycobacterium sp.]
MPNGTPNILVIWGDDIGITNLSCYSDGLMGYRTPNIDRIAKEGMRFTDSYGEQSCTAGRAAFISGQSVYRTGMSKVGIPCADVGWAAEDPTIAELLKPLGYATGQFGKNHFGDMNKHLPTVHGFDEFFGNLYHLNAGEEPEQFDYPHKDQFPKLYELALPRGVLKCRATDEESKEPDDPKFGPVGKQVVGDTGALDTKRMETIDDETTGACIDYIKCQDEAGTPFFVWMNMTHMHLYTHTKPGSRGQAGLWQSEYHDTMIDHDRNVGELPDCLDELGIAETPSSSTQPTTDHIATAGPTPARRRSAVRRTPTGRARSVSLRWCAGPERSRRARCPTRSFSTTTGYRRSLPPRASPISSTSGRPATRLETRTSKFTSTASTCCLT